MARVIYTTCGTSLFTSNCWNGISNTPSVIQSQSPDREYYERKYRRFTEDKMENDLAGKSLASLFDTSVWNDTSQITKLTAELASLKAIFKFYEARGNPLNQNDRIILIHSDNEEGRYCALVVGQVLENLLRSSVSVERMEVNGLDPQSADSFNRALEEIWNYCKGKIRDNHQDIHIFNLTGGYKGTAIILGGLAYKMRATSNIIIFYLHETSDYQNITVNGFVNDEFSAGYVDVSTGDYSHIIGGPIV